MAMFECNVNSNLDANVINGTITASSVQALASWQTVGNINIPIDGVYIVKMDASFQANDATCGIRLLNSSGNAVVNWSQANTSWGKSTISIANLTAGNYTMQVYDSFNYSPQKITGFGLKACRTLKGVLDLFSGSYMRNT